jgi:hypothetical protein
VRTTLAQRASYLTELKEQKVKADLPGQDFYDLFGRLLPDRFWITEISVPELFTANRAKIGEIVVDPVRRAIISVRLPNMFLIQNPATGALHVVETNDCGYLRLRRLARCTGC